MERKCSKRLLPAARMLRKTMTPEERHLWYDFLCSYPVRFARQKMLGRYITDFYCARARLVLELDGSGHDTEEGRAYDEERTRFLEGYGLSVLRIRNSEIHRNFSGVCDRIDAVVRERLDGRSQRRDAL